MMHWCRTRLPPLLLPILSILFILSESIMEHEELTRRVIGGAMTVHRALGAGFLESVYRNALAHELRALGLEVACEAKVQVRYRALVVGDFSADMLVGGCVLIEIKAVRTLAPAHEVQLVNYLTATGVGIGLLLNFGAERLEFKRKTRCYRPGRHGQDEQDEQEGAHRSSVLLAPELRRPAATRSPERPDADGA